MPINPEKQNPDGTFKKGVSQGHGNWISKKKEQLTKQFLSQATPEMILELFEAIKENATRGNRGNVQAQKLLLDKLLKKDILQMAVEAPTPVDLDSLLHNNKDKLIEEDGAE